MSVWLVRAGKQGQHEQWCLETGTVGAGWRETPDLTGAGSREQLTELVRGIFKKSALPNYVGQLWRMRSEIKPGDLVVIPLKTTSQLAIGRVTSGYRYDASADDVHRHSIAVDWIVTDIPRTAVQQDLLYSLGSAMTVCAINRNDAEWRIAQLAETGRDPGARAGGAVRPLPDGLAEAAAVVEEAENLDLERHARDRITAMVAERFAGYEMQELIAAILRALGYVAEVPAKGPDGGVDVVAGSGPLGLDSPRVIVQVKSGSSRVDVQTIQQLQGAITTHGADHGLLVAWGGLTGPALQAVRSQRFAIRVWDAETVISMLGRTYDLLPGEIQAQIPLKSVWVPVDSGE
jgi:restriction system protein